ncbi:MAG: serine hydrolase domain-containing protein [Myxococcota bacterium]|nr:serine hydrolase domain-containing protein [Myxococcota bacterium]
MTVPEELGLSSERLAHIDRHLQTRYIEPGKIAGALTVVARHGEIAYQSAIGLRDRERGTPMSDDTIFRVYSMTKPITSIALMQLTEQAHLQLDDPVHRFLPELRDLRVYQGGNHPRFLTTPCERPMSVRDLLRHTSGLTYGFMERTNVDAAYRKIGLGGEKRFGGTLAEFVEKLAGLPLEFSPGTAWNYSVSTDVLGRIVEVVSGQPFDSYLREHVFDPLGMVDTGFHVPASEAHRFAACYGRNVRRETVLQDDPETSPYLEPPRFLSGGGGLVSTAADYLRFCEMLRRGGELDGQRVIGRKTLQYMTRNHLPEGKDLTELSVGAFAEVSYEATGFGLGFSVMLDPVRSPQIGSTGEFAWGGAASTIFWVDPEEDLVVLFLTQLMPSGTFNFRGQLKQIVYGALVDE